MTGGVGDSTPGLHEEVRHWIADEVDSEDAAELTGLLRAADAGDEVARADLAARFEGPLTFGTAGLRGPLRAGPNGMNRAVVRRAAAGLARYLADAGHAGAPVVVGYDGRHKSHLFAEESVRILRAAGVDARLLPAMLPTPLVPYAVRVLGAAAGVMVTASHNPPEDNGYKVYAGDGAQIVPPVDALIEAAIRAVPSVAAIPLADEVPLLEESLVDSYVAAVSRLVAAPGPRELRVVHTAMHGVGTTVLRRVFAAAGFAEPVSVPEQAWPDPLFPTVAFPNPEEPGAMDLALALAVRDGADVVIANDPDADRCAVGVPGADGWRMLTGDEVGVLLADGLLRRGMRGTYACSLVSSSMLAAMARAHEVPFAETLTGFKWISRAAPDLVFGYEEALGYAVAPALVSDKDGVSAALLVAELAAEYLARGSSLSQRLDELAVEYGRHATRQRSWRVADLALIGSAMARLRADPPATLLGRPVTVTDLASATPASDVVVLRADGARVVVRPSGTEPKCKAYLEVVRAPGTASGPESVESAARDLDRLAEQIEAVLGF